MRDYDFDIDFEPELMILGIELEGEPRLVDSDGERIPAATWTKDDMEMAGDLFVSLLYQLRDKARMH